MAHRNPGLAASAIGGALALMAQAWAFAADPVSNWDNVPSGSGVYTISFNGSAFPTHSPAMTCSPFGINGSVPVCVVSGEAWHTTTPTTFTIRIYRLGGILQGNNFQFTEVTT